MSHPMLPQFLVPCLAALGTVLGLCRGVVVILLVEFGLLGRCDVGGPRVAPAFARFLGSHWHLVR